MIIVRRLLCALLVAASPLAAFAQQDQNPGIDAVPRVLEHQLTMAAKSGTVQPTLGRLRVAAATQLLLDAPLRGPRYIAGDGCCDSTRHVRATLPLNGGAFDAQRFAIDWEQLDEHDRIYVGDAKNPNS